MMGEIAEKYADFSIVTGDNSRSEPTGAIIADILSGMRERAHYTVITNRRRAIERAFDMLREGDSLLLLGKGHEEYMEGPEGKIPFSEREIVLSLIKKKGVPL